MDVAIADFTYFIVAAAIYLVALAVARRKRKTE